jgi:coenzyme PQQ precursor peptide PqqA
VYVAQRAGDYASPSAQPLLYRLDRLSNDAVTQLQRCFNSIKETAMQWTTPAYTDLRFGFEITMYIANR